MTPSFKSTESTGVPSLSSIRRMSASFEYFIFKNPTSSEITPWIGFKFVNRKTRSRNEFGMTKKRTISPYHNLVLNIFWQQQCFYYHFITPIERFFRQKNKKVPFPVILSEAKNLSLG